MGTIMLRKLTLLIVVFGVSMLHADEALLHFDPAQTQVNFTLGDVLHTVHGTFQLKSGEIRYDSATGKVSGQLVIDATSGNSGSKGRDQRMNKNVLETDRFPEIIFTPDRVTGALAPGGAAQLQVHGMFTIHGVAHEMTLPVDAQMANGGVTANTSFAVPYVKWGMKNPSTFILRVDETVDITIHAIGHLASPSQASLR